MAKTYKTLNSIVSNEGIFSNDGVSKLSVTKRTHMLWYAVNGDVEAKHTTGLYLADPTGYDKYPTLIVYVDKPTFVQEFRTMKHIYMTRLEIKGLILKDIQFVLSKDDYKPRKKADKLVKTPKKLVLPELTEEEESLIASQTQNLPESIKESVSKAMSLSIRREKLQDTQE